MGEKISSYKELRVYQKAMESAMVIFEITKLFPVEEKYSMVDQIRRSSRSVCTNIAEAWRKRRYKAAFIAKINDAESEACETQVWVEFANKCRYINDDALAKLNFAYEEILAQLIKIVREPDKWLIRSK